jgi:hypothetical protein
MRCFFLRHCLLIYSMLYLNFGCTTFCTNGGRTIETSTGIIGCILNSDSSVASEVIVSLFTYDFDPVINRADAVLTDTTDVNGVYHFQYLDEGLYAVIARNLTRTMSFMAKDILVQGNSLTRVQPGKLEQPGAISALFLPFEEKVTGYIYIPGTDIYSPLGEDSIVVLNNMPVSTLNTIILANDAGEKRNVLQKKLNVNAGKTSVIKVPLWVYNQRIGLNATSKGAGVQMITGN